MTVAATVTRQDSRFFTHRLDNGLQMIGQQIPGVYSAATVFWVQTGTRDEPPELMGLSHFLEHMAFRRTARYTNEQIDRIFEEMGADHNAGTWLEMTYFWARVLSENVSGAIDLLADLIHPVLDAADFDQERNVILEEIARYEDQPSHALLSRFMSDFYGEHRLSQETLGTAETIKALRVEQMREYWSRRYGASNIIFAIAGNFDWELVVQQVGSLTRGWESGESGRDTSAASVRPGFHVYQLERFTQQQIALGVPSISQSDPRYFAANVLALILGDDTGSRLYWAVQQQGLAEAAAAYVMDFEDNGLMVIYLTTEPDLARRALQAVCSELQRLQDFDVTQDELDRAKAKLNSSVIIGGESTNERVMALIRSWLAEGRLETLEEIRRRIDAVSLDDLKQLLRDFPVAPKQTITAVGPLSESHLSMT